MVSGEEEAQKDVNEQISMAWSKCGRSPESSVTQRFHGG